MRLLQLGAVAAAAGLVACGPSARPGYLDEGTKAAPVARTSAGAAVAPGRAVLVGELCPQGAGGRPAIAPLFVRGVGWSSDAEEVGSRLERSARSFAVLGIDGRRAGVFEVLGLADAGMPSDVAIGSYTGRGGCVPFTDEGGAPPDAACTAATGGCAVAVASLEAAAEGPPDLRIGGACVSGDALIVDVDGDGAAEAFPVAGFVDPVRAPAEEVLARPVVGASCTPRFAHHGLVVTPPPDPELPDDPRYHVALDVLAVVDLDGDGRMELVVAYRYPDGRTVAVYSPTRLPGRLDLVGEAVPWQRDAAP